MKIKSFSISGFFSLDKIRFDLENRGILFVRGDNKDTGGSNGAGKSSFVPESIVWIIFGETIRGIDLKNDVCNDKINEGTIGRVDLDDDYTIVRTRQHKEYGNSLRLFHKTEDISKSSVDLTQKEINKIFNVDFDIFVNSIVLSGSSFRENFLDTKNNILRRNVIETILGIDKFAGYANTIKNKIKEIEAQKSSMILNINQLDKQIKSYNDKIADLVYQKSVFMKEKEENLILIQSKIDKLTRIDVKQQTDIHNQINEGNRTKSKILGVIQGLKNTIKGYESEKSRLSITISRYANFVDKACEYCGSTLDQEKLSTIIQTLSQDKTNVQKQIDETTEKKEQYDIMIMQWNERSLFLKPELSEKELNNIEVEIRVLRENLEKERNQTFQEISFDSDIQKLLASQEDYRKQISELDEEFKHYKFWEEGFGNKGLKTYILEDMVGFLNRKIEFYLNILSKGQMHLIFDKYLDFTVTGLKYRNCSSGERKRVDLAVLIALYDLTNLRSSNNYNILILDEVLDSIDEIGVEAAQDLLLELNKKISTIFVISHNNLLSEYFPDSITIVKENGKSRIEGE